MMKVCNPSSRSGWFRTATMVLLQAGSSLYVVHAWTTAPLLFFVGHQQHRAGLKSSLASTSSVHEDEYDSNGKSTSSSPSNKDERAWSVADDWNLLSSTENAGPDSDDLFNQDLAAVAAREFEASETLALSKEDVWINDVVDEIHNSFADLKTDEDGRILSLYDNPFTSKFDEKEENVLENFEEDMGQDIAMLVRCNENPQALLISEGRAMSPLTLGERNAVHQLVDWDDDTGNFQATPFLQEAVSKMFHRHAEPHHLDNVLCLDRKGVAKWMTLALKGEGDKQFSVVSAHDSRVVKTISDYSQYGSGRLVLEDLQDLYLSTIVGDVSKLVKGGVTPERHLQLRQPFVDAVWRDIRNHGILSPVEMERKRLEEQQRQEEEELLALHQQNASHTENIKHANYDPNNIMMDECEILDWDYRPHSTTLKPELDQKQASGTMSSHKMVEMTPVLQNDKGKTSATKFPLWVRDGEFVFIDEESCIGCNQCANVAPNNFLMLETGRARTFRQGNSPDVHQAVESCPVNCMHPVSFTELTEYETARDEGDGRTDHKHLGHQRGHTPLFVAGIDSDNNHRTSWYHTLKGKCLVSKDCPQKGCYDCPKFGKPGQNPYFQQRMKDADHARAQYFIDNGDADAFRKSADL